MKLTFSFYTILILVISVESGLVKQFFGNVKEDVHTVVDGAVNVIGKGTHHITEGLGVFLHRNEGNKFPGSKTEPATTNQISNNGKIDTNKDNGATHNKHDETAGGNDDSQNYNHMLSTPATNSEDNSNSGNSVHVQNTQQNKPTAETNTNKIIKQDEVISNNENVIDNHTVVPTTATNTGTTTETWFNGAVLENILPTITHNETYFTGDTNELGIGENPNEETKEINNKTAKCDDNIKLTSENNGIKANLVSDQIFFHDNKPKENETNSHYVCAEGLVRTANGECLKQIEIDVRKKKEPMVSNIFVADGCPSGYARALDGSCQKIIG